MAWIKIIREDEATGRLKELYDTDYDQSWGSSKMLLGSQGKVLIASD
jgi:hypothetical protein